MEVHLIVCFYNELNATTEWSLSKYAPECVFEDTSEDQFAYSRAFKKYWTGEQDLIVIEQDIEVESGNIKSLRRCKYNWCTFEYNHHPIPTNPSRMVAPMPPLNESLGFTRYSAALQRLVPFPSEIQWNFLDQHLRWAIKQHGRSLRQPVNQNKGIVSHVHGEVKHHHFVP